MVFLLKDRIDGDHETEKLKIDTMKELQDFYHMMANKHQKMFTMTIDFDYIQENNHDGQIEIHSMESLKE